MELYEVSTRVDENLKSFFADEMLVEASSIKLDPLKPMGIYRRTYFPSSQTEAATTKAFNLQEQRAKGCITRVRRFCVHTAEKQAFNKQLLTQCQGDRAGVCCEKKKTLFDVEAPLGNEEEVRSSLSLNNLLEASNKFGN